MKYIKSITENLTFKIALFSESKVFERWVSIGPDLANLLKSGVVMLDENDTIINFPVINDQNRSLHLARARQYANQVFEEMKRELPKNI